MTRLQRYLDEHGIAAATVEKESGIPRASFRKLRKGRDPRLSTMRRVLRAVRRMRPGVQMEELFDLQPEDDTALDSIDPRADTSKE